MRIPDGTAAVCADGVGLGESQSLGKPGKADPLRGSSPPQGMSQKTYALDSPITREITDGVLVAEKRLRRLRSDAAAYLFCWKRR